MKLLNMRLMHGLYDAASNTRVRSCCGLCMDDTDIPIQRLLSTQSTQKIFAVVVLATQRDNWVYIKMKRDLWHQG